MFSLLSQTLQKTTNTITSLLGSKKDKLTKEELEEILIEADMDYELIEKLLDSLPSYISREALEKAFCKLLDTPKIQNPEDSQQTLSDKVLEVKLIIGVNGAGKTTTIAKLANLYKHQNKKVLLGAGDTFRAAAIEQIKAWGKRLNIPVLSTQHGHDPSALAFDAITHAHAKKYDVVLLDTAGRLHTQTNLTNELLKIIRVSQKALDSLHTAHSLQKYLILDGTQGNSSITQAKYFADVCKLDGIMVTKLDGTSKGGAIFSIAQNLGLPILYLGIGESERDLLVFDAKNFINTLLDSMFHQTNH